LSIFGELLLAGIVYEQISDEVKWRVGVEKGGRSIGIYKNFTLPPQTFEMVYSYP